MKCPKCQSKEDLERIKRTLLSKLLRPRFRRYRCMKCHKTFLLKPEKVE